MNEKKPNSGKDASQLRSELGLPPPPKGPEMTQEEIAKFKADGKRRAQEMCDTLNRRVLEEQAQALASEKGVATKASLPTTEPAPSPRPSSMVSPENPPDWAKKILESLSEAAQGRDKGNPTP